MPAIGEVGVVAVSDDSWNGIWTTRHCMLHHLASFFRVAWLEPMKERGVTLERRPQGWRTQFDAQSVKSIETAGVEGVAKVQPLRWLPNFYRPQWLRDAARSVRYARAASFLRKSGCSRVVLYVWRPSYVDALESRKWFDAVVYHIDDEYSFSETASAITADEYRLIREADAVIIHSPGLADLKGGINDNTYVVPNGVDCDLYTRRYEPPQDLNAIPHPIIGCTGIIKHQLDIFLMRRLVERCSTWSFVFVGPLGNLSGVEAEFEALCAAPNVHILGYRDRIDLGAYQQNFDVCIMPYKVNRYTDCIYPLRLHEYLASGKPVVASPIRTLRDFSHVISLASGVEEWIAGIESSLTEEARSDERVSVRRAMAAQHDWRLLAARVAGIMASALAGDVSKRVTWPRQIQGRLNDG